MGLDQNQRSQNLLNQIKVQDIGPVKKPVGFYKSIILRIASILLAFAVGYSYFKFLDGAWPWWTVLIAGLLFCIASVFHALLVSKFWHRAGFVLAETIVLFIPFYAFDRGVLLLAIVATFLFFLWGYVEGRREFDHETTIRFFRITHGAVAKITTGILVAVILLGLPAIAVKDVLVNESGFTVLFGWAAGFAQSFYPSLSLTGSFGDFTKSIAKDQLKSNATFEAMPQNAQDAAVTAAGTEVNASFSKSLGMSLSAASTTDEVAYQFVTQSLRGWQYKEPFWFMIGWGVFLFLTLRSIGVVFIWIAQFLAMIVYEIFLATGFVHIAEVPQTKEVIEY